MGSSMSMGVSYAERLDLREDLPPIPHTFHQVLDVLDKESTTALDIERIVEQDPVLTMKILRLANSPYYGGSGGINSVARAVVALGLEEVRNLVIGLSLTSAFSGDADIEGFAVRELWLHSIGVAKASKMIAENLPGVDANEIFTAGLIHDLGRFLLCRYFPEELGEIMALKERDGITLLEAEERFGLTHGELGAYLAVSWGLSDFFANVLRYHHRPQGAGCHGVAVGVVFLADVLCQKLGIGWTINGEVDKVLVPRSLGLAPETVKKIAFRLRQDKDLLIEQWSGVLNV